MNDYIRDEIALTIHGVAVGGQIDPGCLVCQDALQRADALMPIVERVKREALEELLTPESLAAARLQVEDELIEWRDLRLSVMRNNGLTVKGRDGSPSSVIRMGFEDAFALVIRKRAAAIRAATPKEDDRGA